MKYEERNGLRILTAEFGYLIHNTQTDVYAEKVYLGIYASLDDFEEVKDDVTDIKLVVKLKQIEAKEESLNKIGKIVANQVTDDIVALSIQEFYDIWTIGVNYKVGQYITHNDILYKVLQDHTSQENWTPNVSPSIFANVLTSLDGAPKEWVKPDSTNAYMKGDKVIYNGKTYVSLMDNNIWSPDEYPTGWEELTEVQ